MNQEISDEHKKILLDKSRTFYFLTFKQIMILMYWDLFRRNKSQQFFKNLQEGKSPIISFKNTLIRRP